jgi:hypothetical protein
MRAFVLSVALLFSAPSVHADDAVIVDAVAARVDDQVIFISDLRKRVHPPFADAAAQSKAMREALDSLIDAAIVDKEAKRLHLEVASDEITRARAAIANQAGLTDTQLSAEVRKQGMTDALYASLLRQQLLEGKLLQLETAKETRPTKNEELDAWFAKRRVEMLARLRAEAFVEVRL